MKLIKQITLYYKKGKSDKVYEIDLCEVGEDKFVVNFRYGRRGGELKDGTKTVLPVSRIKAEQIYDDLCSSKMKKGYKLSLEDSETIQPPIEVETSQSNEIPQVNDPR
ncbi:MAG: WGR domain-containing protein, partial [Spirochaetota bacterium]